MLKRAIGCVWLAAGLVLLAGCGPVRDYASLQPAALEGNWNLVGDSLADVPVGLSVGLAVSGKQVSGQGFLVTQCDSAGSLIGYAGNNFAVSGQIAEDGTFVLELLLPGPLNNSLQIRGTVPAAGGSTWSGSYKFTKPGSTCLASGSGNFTASRMGPLHGVLSGVLNGVGGGAANVTLDMTEGKTATFPRVSRPYDYLPMQGTVTVSGVSCFTRGTVKMDPLSAIGGYFITLDVQMEDGSTALVNATADGQDEKTFRVLLIAVSGDACAGQTFAGTLTRQ